MDPVDLLLTGGMVAGAIILGALLLTGGTSGKQTQRRLEAMRLRHGDSAQMRVESQLKKAIAARQPKAAGADGIQGRIAALALRLERSGTGWSLRGYGRACGTIGLVVAALAWLQTGALLLALVLGLAVGIGLPHMVLGSMIRRRLNGFNARFPDALELLVRGLRSGLPVGETLNVIANEIPGPVGREFRTVVDGIRIGRSMEESLQTVADRLATAEFQFFVITIAIQRETGGNLAETLSNLADVLRKRGQMKLKIRAMSSESKASAYIVGALPFAVAGMITVVNPGYIEPFMTDQRLTVIGLGAMVWMGIGVFVMAKMVSFEI
ncbi:pilus assembly protein TadB [Croceibacterium mercuriale]|uniref:Pilus assembly protein TadB n=1 Tax=Croceibacterium mercuriale TaxID=1572751 RepID=A0A0B2BV32_9SPHN|nr:type II secretion system F family protein [Croceibacterium mercuriale]KHL25259.1 pilus assembly protein TadB [Croceibacterium mercuriale]